MPTAIPVTPYPITRYYQDDLLQPFWWLCVGAGIFAVVLICISVTTNETEHLFLLAIWISSFDKCLFKTSVNFSIGLLGFFLCICGNYYIFYMWVHQLICITNIFSLWFWVFRLWTAFLIKLMYLLNLKDTVYQSLHVWQMLFVYFFSFLIWVIFEHSKVVKIFHIFF